MWFKYTYAQKERWKEKKKKKKTGDMLTLSDAVCEKLKEMKIQRGKGSDIEFTLDCFHFILILLLS